MAVDLVAVEDLTVPVAVGGIDELRGIQAAPGSEPHEASGRRQAEHALLRDYERLSMTAIIVLVGADTALR